MKISEIQGKTDAELEFDLGKMLREVFDLRFRMDAEASSNPSRIRELKRSIARVKTVLNERAKGLHGRVSR